MLLEAKQERIISAKHVLKSWCNYSFIM